MERPLNIRTIHFTQRPFTFKRTVHIRNRPLSPTQRSVNQRVRGLSLPAIFWKIYVRVRVHVRDFKICDVRVRVRECRRTSMSADTSVHVHRSLSRLKIFKVFGFSSQWLIIFKSKREKNNFVPGTEVLLVQVQKVQIEIQNHFVLFKWVQNDTNIWVLKSVLLYQKFLYHFLLGTTFEPRPKKVPSTGSAMALFSY